MRTIIITIITSLFICSFTSPSKSIQQQMEDKYVAICLSKGISILDSLEKHESYLVANGILKDNSPASVYGIWEEMERTNDGAMILKYFPITNITQELMQKGVVTEYVKWIKEGDFNKEAFLQSDMYRIEQNVEALKSQKDITVSMSARVFTDVLEPKDFTSKYYRLVTYGLLPFGRTNAGK